MASEPLKIKKRGEDGTMSMCQWGRFFLTTSEKIRVSTRTVPVDIVFSFLAYLLFASSDTTFIMRLLFS